MFSPCRCTDYVKFFLDQERPEVNEHHTWNYDMCGNISMIQKKHYSSTRSLILEYHTDSIQANNTGFRGQFRFLDKGKCLYCDSLATRPYVILWHFMKFTVVEHMQNMKIIKSGKVKVFLVSMPCCEANIVNNISITVWKFAVMVLCIRIPAFVLKFVLKNSCM